MAPMNFRSKIFTRDALAAQAAAWKKSGQKLGFTSGVFDLVHEGHVSYLEEAKGLCDLLVVGVNSDASVRSLKGPKRPVTAEAGRAALIAALASVDAVFLFDEGNNQQNIEALQPDVYIKAGDYSLEKLSSAGLVEQYGGTVSLVPMKQGLSTSATISHILERFGGLAASIPQDIETVEAPVIFLDRDGTLIAHVEYLHEPAQVLLLPGVTQALRQLKDAGFRLAVVTNQPGIGLGYFSKEQFFKVNLRMMELLSAEGVILDKIYFCPHSKGEGCSCRKPGTGMIDTARAQLKVRLEGSFMIGDMTSDIECGSRAGVKTVLLGQGKAGADKLHAVQPDFKAQDLLEAAAWILDRRK